ncbi:hypothetical protein F5884DRAFT_168579 [Xylogone sp. PMI_703]|nr:hypothetical protein F5884DRAFT_168579 [Xylogone sp. PMI_703]
MASEEGSVSVAAPAIGSNLSDAATTTSPPTADIIEPDSDLARTKSLKRNRAEQADHPHLSSPASHGQASPAAKAPKFAGKFSPKYAPAQSSAEAAVMEEEHRRKDENQRNQPQPPMTESIDNRDISTMADSRASTSRPSDAPVAATAVMTEGIMPSANAVSIPSPMQFDDKQDTSPASATSMASLGSTIPTGTASSTAVASPGVLTSAIDTESRDARSDAAVPSPLDDQSSSRGLSFPANLLGQSDASRGGPARGGSIPMPGQAIAPRSPSQKKHKCPYCETEFTRHHNLKSHLLTHSQEKPYVCQTCAMRFRRLHDLKRHMKLHTGERPHICPKCDRKFARGDALARHSKGQGGCAGRRASMGSFGGEEDYDGSNAGDGEEGQMDGVMYTNGTAQSHEQEMSEEDRRRFSLPSINAQHVSSGHGAQDTYSTHHRGPNTYPPAGPRPPPTSGGLYPPNANRGTSSSSGTSPSMTNSVPSVPSGHGSNTSISSLPLNTGSASMFAQSAITESPKPLSPAGMVAHQLGQDPSSIGRQRSPSLTTQFQQQHYGRRQSGRNSPPGMPLQSPHGPPHSGPKLPALSGLAPPESRYTLNSQPPSQQPPGDNHHAGQAAQQMPAPASPNSMFQAPPNAAAGRITHQGPHHQGSGSIDSNSSNLFAAGDRGVWAYVQTLEDKVKQLSEKVLAMENKEKMQEDKINRLSDELFSLRNQLNAQSQAQQHTSLQGPP